MKVAGACLNQIPFDWENNKKNILEAIEWAKELDVELLNLPELSITGYGCEDVFLSDWIYAAALNTLKEILPATHNITVSVGFPFIVNEKRYNCVALLSEGKILGITAKQFLANDGVHYEPRWFTPWLAGEKTEVEILNQTVAFGDVYYEVNNQKIAFEICEDAWRTNDRPGIAQANNKVDIILNPSASHFAFGKTDTRKALVRASSEQFDCTYVYSNLLGNESGRMIYDGEILIAHKGEVLRRNPLCSYQNVNLQVVDLDDCEAIDSETESKEELFYKADGLALFDYLRKSRSKGFTLSLSGGADSSTCAVLVAQMVKDVIEELGIDGFNEKTNILSQEELSTLENRSPSQQASFVNKKVLITAYQSTRNSGHSTLDSAQKLARSLNAQFYNWSVDEEVTSYTSKIETALGRKLEWETDDLALQNIQARSRSPIIWMLTNLTGTLLITTSNRSEGAVGYATMDGDTSGSIAPIAAVDKHFVRGWLKWAEENLGFYGLKDVNSLEPTAELRPGESKQTDEDDLMPYALLVQIEEEAIKRYRSPLEVYTNLKNAVDYREEQLKKYILKFYTLWSRNQWKRERIAPSFHLDDHNVDPRTWCRFPILSSGFQKELEQLKNN